MYDKATKTRNLSDKLQLLGNTEMNRSYTHARSASEGELHPSLALRVG
jgi:hypothetical protein